MKLTRPISSEERETIRLLWDREQRRRQKVRAKRGPGRANQCAGATYIGGRCANTASPGSDYCYAHKEGT